MNLENFKTKSLITLLTISSFGYWFVYKYFLNPYLFSKIITEKDAVDAIGFMSVSGFSYLILSIIEKYAWKLKIRNYQFFSWLIDIPNINGRYIGKTISSYKDVNGEKTQIDCVVEVTQTASTINLKVYNCHPETKFRTESESVSKVIKINKGIGFYRIHYHYEHKNSENSENSNINYGAGYFDYFPTTKELKGDYFNNRGNRGDITTIFQNKKLQHKFDVANTNQN